MSVASYHPPVTKKVSFSENDPTGPYKPNLRGCLFALLGITSTLIFSLDSLSRPVCNYFFCYKVSASTSLSNGTHHQVPSSSMDPAVAFTLTSLGMFASLSFLTAALVLQRKQSTRHLGLLLVSRHINFIENWERHPLRSSAELTIWVFVINTTYEVLASIPLTLVTSTLTGCLTVFTGEYFSPVITSLTAQLKLALGDSKTTTTTSSLSSSSAAFTIMYGYQSLVFLTSAVTAAHTVVVLAIIAGMLLIVATRLLNAYTPTQRVGSILDHRMRHAFYNWSHHPVRSASELTIFLGTLFGVLARNGDVISALRYSTLCGVLVCLVGEAATESDFVKRLYGKVLSFSSSSSSSKSNAADAGDKKAAALIPTILVVYLIVVTCHYVFAEVPTVFNKPLSIIQQCGIASCASVLYFLVAKIFLLSGLLEGLGRTVEGRVFDSVHNWEVHPVRSAMEVGLTNVFGWAVWYYTSSVSLTTVASAGFAVAVIVLNEVTETSWDMIDFVKSPAAAATTTTTSATTTKPTTLPTFTPAAVAAHSTPSSLYITVNSTVYDVTDFAPRHPGGSIIYKYGGKDVTDQFAAFHRPEIRYHLAKYKVGVLEQPQADDSSNVSNATKEYRKLREMLWSQGYFKPDPSFYCIKAAVFLALIAASALIAVSGEYFSFYVKTILGGACMGIGLQQAAFLAHDAAHHGIVSASFWSSGTSSGINWLAWMLGSVTFGISTNMWNEEHSMHHAITIRPREDPQFNYLPLWLIDLKELGNVKVDGPSGYRLNYFIRKLVGVQHFTFWPLILIVGRVNLHIISVGFEIKNIVTGANMKRGALGLVGMGIYWAWHVAILASLSNSKEVLVFCVAAYLSAGILHIQLLLSHMNVETHTEEEESKIGFFEFQCKTSRNIAVPWYEHWFHGGLEYQIEHHLFPQLPRHSLPLVQPYVQAICERNGVIYREDGFVDAICGVTSNMRDLAWAIVTLDQ
jgi:delta8-fatty-acid desaturase